MSLDAAEKYVITQSSDVNNSSNEDYNPGSESLSSPDDFAPVIQKYKKRRKREEVAGNETGQIIVPVLDELLRMMFIKLQIHIDV